MTKFLNNKIVLFLLPLALLAVIGLTANAQTGGNCQVTGAAFRTNRPVNSSFFVETNTPYVYIDIQTQNCVGETIEVSITEDDLGVDDDVDGTLGIADDCDNSNNSCMDNRIITVFANNFTLSLRAGEDECQDAGDPDCEYHLETWDEVESGHEWPSILGFDCDGACNINWQYLGPLSIFGGSHASDPDIGGGPGGGTTGSGPGGGTTGSGPGGGTTPGTATTAEGPTVIDLNLTNPLAGTIDTLPMLFQKIVYIIIKIAIPLIAIAIIYSGLLFVTARGNEEQLKKAKNALTFAIIGGLVLLASWLVANAIRDALTTLSD